jgi:hypothetical protein
VSFEIHPNGYAMIGGVPFCPGPKVRVFDDLRLPPPGVCPGCGERGTRHRGVQLDMANGLELSIMFGTSNYCDAQFDPNLVSSPTAEVGLFGPDGRMIGDPAGWVEAADVLALIPVIAGLDPQQQIGAREHLSLRSPA